MWTDLRLRARSLFRRRAVESELDEELRFHLEQLAGAYEASGLPSAEAWRRARLDLGGVEQVKEEHRDARGVALLETFLQDIRYGLRSLRRTPGFAASAVATIVLTTGALSTVLTLADALLWRPLSVPHPEDVVVVSSTRRRGSGEGYISYPDYAHLRDHTRTLSGLATHYSTAPLWVAHGPQVKELQGAVVSANFFPLLGVQPAIGRFFTEDEDREPDRDRVAVLSHELWRSWFDSSPAALGATLTINSVPFTVIGVAPPSFPGLRPPNDLYIPAMMLRVGYRWCDVIADADCTPLAMIGRLAPGRRLEEARAEMEALVPPAWVKRTEGNTGLMVERPRGVRLRPDPEDVRSLKLLGLVAALLLLVCCANLAGLLMARGSARVHELAVRASLGASRRRLVRQLMTEALLLAVVGGAGGVVFSLLLTRLLQLGFYSFGSEGYRFLFDFSLRTGVILAVLAASAGAAFLFGLFPALRAIRLGVSPVHHSARVSARSRVGRGLVAVQSAVAVGLVGVALLLAASSHSLRREGNFEPSHVALFRLRPRLMSYSPERAQAFHREVIRRLETVPGVRSITLLSTGIALKLAGTTVSLPGEAARASALETGYGEVGTRYFETLGTPVLQGREFAEGDVVGSTPVAVVSQSLASRLWPEGRALGTTLLIAGRPHEVVGVAADVRLEGRDQERKPYVYVPFWQKPDQIDARYCVRVEGEPGAILPTLAREVNRIDPGVPVTETLTLPFQLTHGRLKPVRLGATFVGYAAGLGVLLSALGLYGTLAYSVSRRTQEIGIRMALGAARTHVFGLVLGEGMAVVLAGVGAGLFLAASGARLVRHLLYGAPASDVLSHAAAALLVAAAGLLACWIPARRAARVDPMVALRAE